MIIRANEVKVGLIVKYSNKILLIKDITVQSPTARGANTLYKIRFFDISARNKIEERFKGEDVFETVELDRRPVDLSYVDGDEYVFMDKEDFTLFPLKKEVIEDELLFITEEQIDNLNVLLIDGNIASLELPQTVDMEIIETSPSIKGASASARTKPAKMKTGLQIQVPEYLSVGDKIRIHVAEKRYMGRV